MSFFKNRTARKNKVQYKDEYENREIEYSEMSTRQKELLLSVEYQYLVKEKTVKETCSYFKVPFNRYIQRLFSTVFPKCEPNQRGGKRKGAGNKKGITFCKKCRKIPKNCTC